MKIPLIEQPQFQCNACGKCCSHIRGFIPKEDKQALKDLAFGKLPLIQVAPVERMTFPLWEWEAKRFIVWGTEVQIEPNIKPLRGIFDLNTDTFIVLHYFMDAQSDACPFLKDSKCAIYKTKRAYVCRLFPFNKSPLSIDYSSPLHDYFGDCASMEKILPALPKEKSEAIEFLKSAFPNGEFENAIQHDLIVEWSNKKIMALIKSKIIRPAMNYPYDKLLRRIEHARHISFLDFLIEQSLLTAQEKDAMIARFDANTDAQEWLLRASSRTQK